MHPTDPSTKNVKTVNSTVDGIQAIPRNTIQKQNSHTWNTTAATQNNNNNKKNVKIVKSATDDIQKT